MEKQPLNVRKAYRLSTTSYTGQYLRDTSYFLMFPLDTILSASWSSLSAFVCPVLVYSISFNRISSLSYCSRLSWLAKTNFLSMLSSIHIYFDLCKLITWIEFEWFTPSGASLFRAVNLKVSFLLWLASITPSLIKIYFFTSPLWWS